MRTPQRPSVVVLLSDGLPTDDAEAGLETLLASDGGAKAVRIAVAIGSDADMGLLQEFIAHPNLKPLQASNPDALLKRIRWATSAPVKRASVETGRPDAVGDLAQDAARENTAEGDMVW